MRTTSRSLAKLVVFAVVTILLTSVLAATMGNLSWSDGSTFHVRFTDVTGLQRGDDVRIAGVRVGSVKELEVDDEGVADVSMAIDDGTPMRTTTRARVRYRNLVGQRYISLTEGPGVGEPLEPGGIIPLEQTEEALDLTVLFNGFKPLFTALTPKDVNALAFEIIRTLQGEGGTIDSLLNHTASLTNTIADRDAAVGRVVTNLNTVLATVDSRDAKLSGLLAELQRFVSGLSSDRDAILGSLASIDSLAESTAGLIAGIRPALRADIEALAPVADRLAADGKLERLTQELPGRLSALIGTANYGSWQNFFLCEFTGTITVPTPGGPVVRMPNFVSTAPRCQ
ncbi:MAG TPA: MlaD family protein [Mycobacteriales bacterium]|nr:MlaD family protein [Mycobacteriales bacterium]